MHFAAVHRGEEGPCTTMNTGEDIIRGEGPALTG